jgi:protein TonB
MRFSFPAALAISLLAHVAFLAGLKGLPGAAPQSPGPAALPLEAQLLPAKPVPAAPSPPRLDVPDFEDTSEGAQKPAPPPKMPQKKLPARRRPPQKAEDFSQAANRQLAHMAKGADFYPRASIAAGEEGQVLVLAFLDGKGNVIAARVEQSSGFARLDAAALRAVRRLKNLPGGLAEGLLPVRFRLE